MKKYLKFLYVVIAVVIVAGALIYNYYRVNNVEKQMAQAEPKEVVLELVSHEKNVVDTEGNMAYAITVKKIREEGYSEIVVNCDEALYEAVEKGAVPIGSQVTVQEKYIIQNGDVARSECIDHNDADVFMTIITK